MIILYSVEIPKWDNDKAIVLRFYSESCIVLKIHNIMLYSDNYTYHHYLAYRPIELNKSNKLIEIVPFEKKSYNKITFICEDENGNRHKIRLLSDKPNEMEVID